LQKALAEAPEASAPQRLRAMRLYIACSRVLYATGLRVSELVTLAALGVASRRPP